MTDKQGSSDERNKDKQGSLDDKSDGSTPTQQRPQRRRRRRRRHRVNSASSDGIVIEAERDFRHMENLFLHSGKLCVFRVFFGDPDIVFFTRPDGRRRHAAGDDRRNRPPPLDENRALAALGVRQEDLAALYNDSLQRPLAIQVDERPPPSVSSRGLSPGSTLPTFTSEPSDSDNDFDLVPFAGLPPMEATGAIPKTRPKPKSVAAAEHDDYDGSDSDEPAWPDRAPRGDFIRVDDTLDRMRTYNSNFPFSYGPFRDVDDSIRMDDTQGRMRAYSYNFPFPKVEPPFPKPVPPFPKAVPLFPKPVPLFPKPEPPFPKPEPPFPNPVSPFSNPARLYSPAPFYDTEALYEPALYDQASSSEPEDLYEPTLFDQASSSEPEDLYEPALFDQASSPEPEALHEPALFDKASTHDPEPMFLSSDPDLNPWDSNKG